MKNLNKCQFIGRLGKDPEARYLPDGTMTVSFSIACQDDYKDKSGAKAERTEWVRLVAFGKLAEIINQYTRKGSKIYAEGKFTTRKWVSNGVDAYITEIRLESIEMLDSAKGDNGQENSQQPARDNFDDDLPF